MLRFASTLALIVPLACGFVSSASLAQEPPRVEPHTSQPLPTGGGPLAQPSAFSLSRGGSTEADAIVRLQQRRRGCISDGEVFIIPLGFTAGGAALGLVANLIVGLVQLMRFREPGSAPDHLITIGAALGLVAGISIVATSPRCGQSSITPPSSTAP